MPTQLPSDPASEYTKDERVYRFNDHVCMECMLGVPIEKRTGRLVQVRKGCGQFGSDLYFVRLRDGSLMTFENVLIRPVGDRGFEDAFYVSNGRQPPTIPDQPVNEVDSTEVEYTMAGGKYPAAGFIVTDPDQPQTPGAFAIAVIRGES